jgi:hypothetical protein
MMKLLRKFVESPHINILIGLILLLSGLIEAWDTLFQDIMSGNFGARHGVIIFGLFQILKSVPDIFEGMEKLTKE